MTPCSLKALTKYMQEEKKMNNFDEYTVRRFPLQSAFEDMLKMMSEGDLIRAKMSVSASNFMPNIMLQSVFDRDEMITITVEVRPFKKEV